MAVFDLLSEAGINSIFLVGDPDQAIYEWRDENPECFLEKMNNHMWQNIELTGNFRSSQNICNVTSFFLRQAYKEIISILLLASGRTKKQNRFYY